MKRSAARAVFLATLLPLAAACPGEPESGTDSSNLTRAQRDSMIGESQLPGAGAVKRALDAAESARERAEALDSISR